VFLAHDGPDRFVDLAPKAMAAMLPSHTANPQSAGIINERHLARLSDYDHPLLKLAENPARQLQNFHGGHQRQCPAERQNHAARRCRLGRAVETAFFKHVFPP
jgi:hypothetical protein